MQVKLNNNGLNNYFLVSRHRQGYPDGRIMRFHDHGSARTFLFGFLADAFSMRMMRTVLSEAEIQRDLWKLNDQDVIAMLACAIDRGRISVIEAPVETVGWHWGNGYRLPEEKYVPIKPMNLRPDPEEEEEIILFPFVEDEEPLFLSPFVEDEEPIGVDAFVEARESDSDGSNDAPMT